jgi:hypothetical protein
LGSRCRVALAAGLGAVALGIGTIGVGPASAERQTVSPMAAASGLQVHFYVRTLNGRPVAIKRFRFEGLLASCHPGTITLHSTSPLPPMPVNRRHRFHGDFRFHHRRRLVVKGKIVRGGKRAYGSLRASGNFGSHKRCRTGAQRWHVAKT